jgi:pectinesterase
MSASFFLPVNRRSLLRSAICVGAGNLVGCATTLRLSYDAIVSNDTGARGAEPVFSSIQAALDAAPATATQPHRIFIAQGRWREKLTIDKPFIHLIGADRELSVVSYDAYAGQTAPDGQPWGTLRSASIAVRASDCSLTHLTIENAFDYPRHLLDVQGEPTGANRLQAVALMLQKGADKTFVSQCNITGYQDTLCANAGRSVFRDCRIAGTVDFIFGAGCAVFEKCVLLSRFRSTSERQGYVVAPSTPLSQDYGFIFQRCRLVREAQMPPNSVSLGRAWRPTTTFPDGRYGDPNAVGMAVYVHCWMDDHIAIERWDAMEYGARDGSRVALQPEEARFFEYQSRGPGAGNSSRHRLLSDQEVKRYDTVSVLRDWNP